MDWETAKRKIYLIKPICIWQTPNISVGKFFPQVLLALGQINPSLAAPIEVSCIQPGHMPLFSLLEPQEWWYKKPMPWGICKSVELETLLISVVFYILILSLWFLRNLLCNKILSLSCNYYYFIIFLIFHLFLYNKYNRLAYICCLLCLLFLMESYLAREQMGYLGGCSLCWLERVLYQD